MTAPVRITHPFHPLFGQEIDCVERRIGFGEDLLFYRDRLGYVTALPTGWTTAETDDPFLLASAGRSRFRVADLIVLADLIAGLQVAARATEAAHEP